MRWPRHGSGEDRAKHICRSIPARSVITVIGIAGIGDRVESPSAALETE